MHRFGLALLIAAIAMPVADAATRRRQPAWEVKRDMLSPSARRRAVLADFKRIMTGPTSKDSLTSKPYYSSVEGLCRRDVLALAYDRVGKPVALRWLGQQFHYLGASSFRGSPDAAYWLNACNQLDAARVGWVTSDDDKTAILGFTVVDDALDLVRSGTNATIECAEISAPDFKCDALFIAAASRIVGISHCPDWKPGSAQQCFNFSMDPYNVTIVRTPSNLVDGRATVAIRMEPAPLP